MNFQTLPPVPQVQELLDNAFRKARVRGSEKKLYGTWLEKVRKKEALKLDLVKETIASRLEKVTKDFPHVEALPNFYQELMRITLDVAEFRKSLAALRWAAQKISILHREAVRKIMHEQDQQRLKQLTPQSYGRISSVLKQISKNLHFLEQCRKMMKSYPDIKEMFTVCLYGFPNVGKSTLLNKLAQTKAEVAPYAFTTKSINIGYLTLDGKKIQLVDVPGTLARKEKMNLIEMQAELVLRELASLVIFVFDASEYGGYSRKQQHKLLQKADQRKPLVVYLSKTDLLQEGQEFDEPLPQGVTTIEEVKEKILAFST